MRERLTGVVIAFFAALVAVPVLAGTAQAAVSAKPLTAPNQTCGAIPDKKEGVIAAVGCLEDNRTSPPSPVEGVNISVEDDEGNVLGEGASDANGRFRIELGSDIDVVGETVTVKIDEGSLPEGSVLTNPEQVEVTKRITISDDISFTFPIGPDPNPPSPWYEQGLQLAVGGIVFSLLLALGSLGLSMVFGTTGLTNFSHGELITFGAIVAFAFNAGTGLPVVVAGLVAVALSAAFGYAQDSVLWRPLRRRGTGLIAMMIVTIGLGIFLRNVYQYVLDADNHNYTQYATVEPWELGFILLTPKEAIVAGIALAVLVVVTIALQRTRIGKATRAVADNPALASSSGINVDRVISVVWTGGAALAGLSGFLLGLTQGFDYQLGFKILLLVFAAVILGGLGTIWGAIMGSLIVGLFIEISTLVVPPELKFAGALGVLIIVLLFRPQGLLGRPERVG